jgi:hypothetical protein
MCDNPCLLNPRGTCGPAAIFVAVSPAGYVAKRISDSDVCELQSPGALASCSSTSLANLPAWTNLLDGSMRITACTRSTRLPASPTTARRSTSGRASAARCGRASTARSGRASASSRASTTRGQGTALSRELGALHNDVTHGEAAWPSARRRAPSAALVASVAAESIPDVRNKSEHAILSMCAAIGAEDVRVVGRTIAQAAPSIARSLGGRTYLHGDIAGALPHCHVATEVVGVHAAPGLLISSRRCCSRKIRRHRMRGAELHHVNLAGPPPSLPVVRSEPERRGPGAAAVL